MESRDQLAWTDDELMASVEAYRDMQMQMASGQSISKRETYHRLALQYARTPKAFELRMQNISAVLSDLGLPWLPGLRPAANVGEGVKRRLIKMLSVDAQPGYAKKIPDMRYWLIQVAKHREVATYGSLMAAFSIDRFSLRAALGRIGHGARRKGEPILTALVINKATRRCSGGLAKEFGVVDDAGEREHLYEYWAMRDSAAPRSFDEDDDSLEAKAARFARVKVRPDQASFRRAVFLACGGQCVVSGCTITCTLDAAHMKGRSWQAGHNRAEDGLLMRKDLHALYDAGHLRINAENFVEIDEEIRLFYPGLSGKLVRARFSS